MVSKEFLEERSRAIGGSDVPHLLGLPPFGCQRRLWYDKKGQAPDFPFLGNRHTRRGEAMEPFAIALYEQETRRKLLPAPWEADARVSYIGCHADAIQLDTRTLDMRGLRGLLEAKCPSARYYYAVRARPQPPNEANVQLQWNLAVHRLRWGTVLLFCADAWDLRYWDVEADPTMQADLRELAGLFWKTLKDSEPPFHRLDPHDGRCRSCPWRKTCQDLDGDGEDASETEAAVVHSLGDLLVVDPAEVEERMLSYIASRRTMKDAEAQYLLDKARLEGLFPAPGRIVCASGEIRLKTVARKGFTSVVGPTTYQKLRVIPKVEEPFHDERDIETH